MKTNKRGVSSIIIVILVTIGILLIGFGIYVIANNKYGSVVDRLKFASETKEENFVVEEIEGGVKIIEYIGKEEIVFIPAKIKEKIVISIGEKAFMNNLEVKGIKLPDTLTVIESEAFENCMNLEVFISGKGLRTISSYAFNYCKKLKTVQLNEGLETLQTSCFNSTGFERIYIPSSVSEINLPISLKKAKNITIIAEKDSYAANWAEKWGFLFEEK